MFTISEGTFYFGGHLRWNLGWPTPNYAGAFVATVLPLGWLLTTAALRRGRWAIAAGLLLVEGAAGFALAKTYSRGGLLAAVLALGTFVLIDGRRSRAGLGPLLRREGWALALRIALLAGVVGFTGFQQRIAGGATGQDASVGNRLAFWRESGAMVQAAPIWGWGPGASGRAYMNWYEEPDRTEGFLTPDNSFLHVAIEFGLPLTVVALLLIFLPLALAARVPPADAVPGAAWPVTAAAAAVMAAWLVANVFSTLWFDWRLAAVPAVALGWLYGAALRDHELRPWLRAAAGTALGLAAASVALVFVTPRLAHPEPCAITARPNGAVELSRPVPAAHPLRVVAWLDEGVMGLAPGKELRRWLNANPAVADVLVLPDGIGVAAQPEVAACDLVLLVGRQATRLGDLPADAGVLLVNPEGEPPAGGPAGPRQCAVILPELDQTGDAARWTDWARRLGARVIVARGCGQDVRMAWPQVAALTPSLPWHTPRSSL